VAALAVVAGSFSTSDAAGGNPRKTVSREPTMVEVAVEQYNKGLKHRDKAWKYETKPAAAAVEKDRTKNLDKARREYEKAAARFESAVDKNPRMHEAFSSLGYARRQLGLYEQALTAYDTALGLDPNYAQAVEYRAETYLALDRVAEAQRAYYQLLGLDG
jgi:tetratricopeptide (TPR) repeat protein